MSAGKYDALEYLIERGIDLNIANNEGMTPLMLAALQGDKEMVELMIASNADPAIATESGATAYTLAFESGRKLVAFLIAESAVLHGITEGNMEQIIKYIHNGAYVNIITPAGWTPLISAAAGGHDATVNELLALGANVSLRDVHTYLHMDGPSAR